jgi:hypothetical protein
MTGKRGYSSFLMCTTGHPVRGRALSARYRVRTGARIHAPVPWPATHEHEKVLCPLFLSPTAIKRLPIAVTFMVRRYAQFRDTNNSGLILESLTLQTVTVSDTFWGIKSSYGNGTPVPYRMLAHGSRVCLHNLTWYGYCSL